MTTADLEHRHRERLAAHLAGGERPGDVEWVKQLLALMFERDQEYREAYVRFLDAGDEPSRAAFAKVLKESDQDNRRWLEGWLETHEWPRLSRYGAEACEHAWMIALHSDAVPGFQTAVVRQMEPLLARGEVDPVQYAALFDRALLAEGRPQRFGMFHRAEGGVHVPYDVEEPETLAERRARLGIGDVSFRR